MSQEEQKRERRRKAGEVNKAFKQRHWKKRRLRAGDGILELLIL